MANLKFTCMCVMLYMYLHGSYGHNIFTLILDVCKCYLLYIKQHRVCKRNNTIAVKIFTS